MFRYYLNLQKKIGEKSLKSLKINGICQIVCLQLMENVFFIKWVSYLLIFQFLIKSI